MPFERIWAAGVVLSHHMTLCARLESRLRTGRAECFFSLVCVCQTLRALYLTALQYSAKHYNSDVLEDPHVQEAFIRI